MCSSRFNGGHCGEGAVRFSRRLSALHEFTTLKEEKLWAHRNKMARHGGASENDEGGLTLTNEQIVGRLMVLEVLTTTAFGLCLANTQNDPDFSKAGRLLEQTREAISSLAMTLPAEARVAAEQYASQLLTVLTQHLRDLTRGGASGA